MIQVNYYKFKDVLSVKSFQTQRDHVLKNEDKQYLSLYQIVQQDQQH